MLEQTCSELELVFPGKKESLRMGVFAGILAVLNAGLMPTLPGHPDLDLRDEPARQRFLEYLVGGILGN